MKSKKISVPLKKEPKSYYLSKIDRELKQLDFKQAVSINHMDGSTFYFNCAKVLVDKKNTKCLYVWTEHTGYHFFHLEDLYSYNILRK